MTNFKEDILQPKTLHEALNIIKFLNTTHKREIAKFKEDYLKQADIIKKLEANRKKELEFLTRELQKYEVNLVIRTENVAKQLLQKDDIIQKQSEIIEELNKRLKISDNYTTPEINVITLIDSNSDSGIAMENDESPNKDKQMKTENKTIRKCSRRFADSISFLRRVDFSPIKYKPSVRHDGKKKEEKKNNLEVPIDSKRFFNRQCSNDKPLSDDETAADSVLSDSCIEPFMFRPKKVNDSMNNHFSDDGSEDTSEEIFDRVMTRSSIRRSVKANPKYKKISRTKSKLLEQVKVNILD